MVSLLRKVDRATYISYPRIELSISSVISYSRGFIIGKHGTSKHDTSAR